MKKRNLEFTVGGQLKTFHPNSKCSAYRLGEFDFIARIWEKEWSRLYRQESIRGLSPEYEGCLPHFYVDQIERCKEWARRGRIYTDEVARFVCRAVTIFGVDALRLSRGDDALLNPVGGTQKVVAAVIGQSDPRKIQELRYKQRLGSVICDVLRFWREQAERGTVEERRKAIGYLRTFGKAFIPEARGKRENTRTASLLQVKEFYFKALYRLYHVEHYLKDSSGPRDFSLRVKGASERYNIEIDQIRECWCLDEDDQPQRPSTIKDMARRLTAKRFKISPRRVSNLLAS